MSDEESMTEEEYQLYWQHMEMLKETDPSRYHTESCEDTDHDGWSHAFDVSTSQADPNDDNSHQVSAIRSPACQVLNFFTADNWQKMRDEISQSTVLETIDLSCSSSSSMNSSNSSSMFSVEYTASLFGGWERRNLSSKPKHRLQLEELSLVGNEVGRTGMAVLVPFLLNSISMKWVNLANTSLDNEGARMLSGALQHVHIECLFLNDNFIGDEGVEYLLSTQKSANLLILAIRNNDFGRRGYEAISRFLGRDDISLEELFVNCPDLECAELVINSVPNSSKLKTLSVCDLSPDEDFTASVATAVQNLVCSTSSFDAICSSNHQLRKLGMFGIRQWSEKHPILQIALEINARSKYGASTVKRMRSKLRTFYFQQAFFDVHSFIDMNVKLMPYVLELVTKSELSVGNESHDNSVTFFEIPAENLDGLYRLLRNCHVPELFRFPSPELTIRLQEVRIQQLEAENAALKADNARLRAKE